MSFKERRLRPLPTTFLEFEEPKVVPLRRSSSFTGFVPYTLNGSADDCGRDLPDATDESWGEECSTRADTTAPSPPPTPGETLEGTEDELEPEPMVVWPDTDEDEPWQRPVAGMGVFHPPFPAGGLARLMLPDFLLPLPCSREPAAHVPGGPMAAQGAEAPLLHLKSLQPRSAEETSTGSSIDGSSIMEGSSSEVSEPDELKLTAQAMVEHLPDGLCSDISASVRLCNLQGDVSRERLIKALSALGFAGRYKLLGIQMGAGHQGACFATVNFTSQTMAFKFQKAWNAKFAAEKSLAQATLQPSRGHGQQPTRSDCDVPARSELRSKLDCRTGLDSVPAPPARKASAKVAAGQSNHLATAPARKSAGAGAPPEGPQLAQARKTADLALQKVRAMMPPVNMKPSKMRP